MDQDYPHKPAIPEHWLHWTFLSPELLIAPLYTINRQPLKTIDPGQLNFDNGPDIRSATLNIGGVLQKGDVEFHINPQDWFRHGHHEDRRYDNIILHVLWEAPPEIDRRLRGRFPHVVLKHQLRIPYSEWTEKMLQLEAEDARKTTTIPGRLTPSLLKQLAEARFERKVQRFKYWLEQFSIEDVFMIALGEAFGYSKNKFPFRQLLWETPPSKIFQATPKFYASPMGIWVYLALRASLLTTHSFTRLALRQNPLLEKVHNLFRYFNREGTLAVLQLPDWYFSRVRPANNPIIRVAALAQIIFQHRQSSPFEQVLQAAMARTSLKELMLSWQSCLQIPINSQLSQAVESVYGLRFPNRHTMGTCRMKQFIVNSVFPLLFLWAERKKNHGFQQYLLGLYEEFPACEDTGLLNRSTSGTPLPRAFSRLAIYQQGLLEFFARQSLGSRLHFHPSDRIRENKSKISSFCPPGSTILNQKPPFQIIKEPDISFCI